MNNSSAGTYVFKGISLLILDVVTILLVFSVWALLNISLFPWAFGAILITLILLNIVFISSKNLMEKFGIGSYTSVLICTIVYYLITMFFTGTSYLSISIKSYIIIFLILTFFYVGAAAGLYFAGLRKREDVDKQKDEQLKVSDLNLRIFSIEESLVQTKDIFDKIKYEELFKLFNDMNERLKSSTPFGRTTKSVAVNFENRIIAELNQINKEVDSLKSSENHDENYKTIIGLISELKTLIINREKSIVQ